MIKQRFKQTEIGKIPEDWEVKELQKISKVIDSCHKTPKYSSEGIPMVRVTDIKSGNLDLKGTLKVTREVYDEFTLNHKPTKNDIIMSRVGTYGITSYVNKPTLFCLGQNTVVIHPLINSRFIYYALNSKLVKKQIEEVVVGSTQKTVSLKDIRELLLPHPNNSEELEKIAKILSELDAKIELNNNMKKTLEKIGQVLFKRWFIDFEFPNEEGNPYKSSNGGMVQSELGKIPRKWEIGKLRDVSRLQMGISPKGDSYNEEERGLPLLNGAADFSGKLVNPKKFTTAPVKVCKKGDLIFCVRATIGNLTFADKEYSLGRGVAALSINPKFEEFVYHFLENSLESLISGAHGSVIKGLSKPDIEGLKVAFPMESIIKKFNDSMYANFEMQRRLDKENAQLSKLRDYILPKLMSGEIRVK